MTETAIQSDKAGAEHWRETWDKAELSRPINLEGARGYAVRQLARWLDQAIALKPPVAAGMRLLELGCGNSAWLPYLAKTYGLFPWGLDYDEVGYGMAKTILFRDRVRGVIVKGDLFAPAVTMLDYFELVYSHGLVEHFNHLPTVLGACARYIRPGGRIITIVPNMRGLTGALQRRFNPAVFEKHVPHTLKALREGHEAIGLRVLKAEYIGSFNPGVLNLSNLSTRARKAFTVPANVLGLALATSRVWLPSLSFSPLIGVVAQKGI